MPMEDLGAVVPEVEFVDDDSRRTDDGLGLTATLTTGTLRLSARVTAVAGWVVAAGLLLAAPFTAVNSVAVTGTNVRVPSAALDGWGRDRPAHSLTAIGHGVRFGIGLWLCAAVLLLAAVLMVAQMRRPSVAVGAPAGTLTRVAAAAAPALIIGVGLSMTLTAWNFADQLNATFAARRAELGTQVLVVHVTAGACVWLTLAALGCTLIGSFAALRKPARVAEGTTGTTGDTAAAE